MTAKEEEKIRQQEHIKALTISANAIFLACDKKVANDVAAKMNNSALMIGRLIDEVDSLKDLILEASDYLDTNELTSIGNQSILHKKFKELAL